MKPRIFLLQALSALHCGTGQSAGVVDLPIARARASNLPMVPGSSVRGVLREYFAESDPKLESTLFGPRSISGADDAFAGALAIGDAHLLLLPVRSMSGIVAYATCPYVLKRYASDCGRAGKSNIPDIPSVSSGTAHHGEHSENVINNKIVLEDLDLNATTCPKTTQWARLLADSLYGDDQTAKEDLASRLVIISDSEFAFLAETGTEIRTRIALDPATGTVKPGALWNEENLPAESVLWGVYALGKSRNKKDKNEQDAEALAQTVPHDELLQLGGKAGVGRGLTRFIGGGE